MHLDVIFEHYFFFWGGGGAEVKKNLILESSNVWGGKGRGK